MYTISLLNMKGGVGKTTTSVNLATGIAMQGHSTLLVDLDPQSNTTSMFLNEDPEIAAHNLLKGEVPTTDAILSVGEKLWLIPSELSLANTETELRVQTNAPQHNRLQKALSQVKDRFQYCIVDCPPILNLLTLNAIITSDLIIVPIKPDRFALRGYGVTMQNISQIREHWELSLDVKVLFTIVNRNNEERDIITHLRELDGVKAYSTVIRSQPKPIASASSRMYAVITDTSKGAVVAEDMRAFVAEVLGG